MNTEYRIRVMIVDDHLVVRDGLKTFLSIYDDLEIVGEAGDGEEAVRVCSQLHPDVVLMDLVMPRMDGPTATKMILEENPDTQVVAITSFAEEGLVQGALRAGAISYILKDIHADELAQAIRAAHQGHTTIDSEAAQILIKATTQPLSPGSDLTDREMEVLTLIVEGKTNQEISEDLTISLGTARFHVSNILSKLGAKNRTEAARLALKHNLVS